MRRDTLVCVMRWLAPACALALLSCGHDETLGSHECPGDSRLASASLCDSLAELCALPSDALPALGEAVTVVPDAEAMPPEVVSQVAHNNLDVVWHAGRLYFAFRTGPFHFAHPSIALYVVSTTDQKSWRFEAAFSLGKDLREPRFLPVGDRLFLYFARLREVTFTFTPEAMMLSERSDCGWTQPEEVSPVATPGFIPWRGRVIDGTSYLIGYAGGENIYELGEGAIEVHWLKTADGRTFEPVVPGKSAVLVGGGSETDFAFLGDGSVIAVSRNEAGDADGFGSKICRAPAGALGDWSCVADPKKYDSPLVFSRGDQVYLIGRRQLANDGKFDLGMDGLTPAEQGLEYQTAYWGTPKRCALWKVDPVALSVSHLLDLPSNGDTCFASEVPLSDDQRLIYNYSSPLDDPDLSWRDGQFGPTHIYRTLLTLP
jgi:hypothetical protein